MSKITLSMIVKNEEQYLRGCLESVKDIADEIVIVDTGSTDSTLEIAKEFNAKIYHFEWIKDFSAARNFALSKSTGNWILYLDADERIEGKSKKEILRKTKENKSLAIKCVISNLDFRKESPTLMKYVRLFRNNKNIFFTGKAHEQIEPSLAKLGYRLVESTIKITHLGYNVETEKLKEKANRNLELLVNDYNEKPTTYGAYQIANSYSVLDEMDQAIIYTEKALLDKNLQKEFKSVCYLRIANYNLQKENLSIAKEFIDKGINNDKNHPLLNLLASQVYKQLNEVEKAIVFCKNSFQQNSKLHTRNKTQNVLDITIDNKKIIYQGISLSIDLADKGDLNFFLNKLKFISNNEYGLIINILQNSNINKEDVSVLINMVNKSSLDIAIKLFEKNNNIDFQLEFYSKIYDRFNRDLKYLTTFGSFLIDINQLEEAEMVLKLTLDNNEQNHSGIFYLASIYVQQGKYSKLNELINIADEKIKIGSPFHTRLQILKEKISPLINSLLV